ncbi:MAG TPA: rhomboid family intramembrane serine protease [Polyangiaceae bacterium]|nr:rhomboid family intramembrane serine protease [Polyangiaceae bacterium]
MDPNIIALWFAGIQALSMFSRSARTSRQSMGWAVVSGLVLLTGAVGWLRFRDQAGYVTFALTALFITLPWWAHGVAARALKRSQYRRAYRFASFAALLHPADGWRQLPRLFRAFDLAQAGKVSEAESHLAALSKGDSNIAATARAHRLRILERWDEIKLLAERTGLATLARDPNLLILYLRALGELEESNNLAEFMLNQEALLLAGEVIEPAFLYLFVYTGHVELTRQVLAAANPGYDQETREAWLALASLHAGNFEQARQTFTRLRQSDNASIRERAQRYLGILSQTNAYQPPTPRTAHIVTHFARAFAQRQSLILNHPQQRTERRVTLALVVINALIYAWGSYPLRLIATTDEFGSRWAFIAQDILSGEWWRMFSYFFVHANWLHLAMNLLGLWALGPFIERAFGRLRFSLIYLFSGFTGSVVYLCLAWYQIAQPESGEPQVLVGASGCIMGLLGATGAVVLRAWVKHRAPMAKQILLRLLVVVALQVTFDYNTPQVAGLAHALGLLGGFIAGLLLHERVSERSSVQALS